MKSWSELWGGVQGPPSPTLQEWLGSASIFITLWIIVQIDWNFTERLVRNAYNNDLNDLRQSRFFVTFSFFWSFFLKKNHSKSLQKSQLRQKKSMLQNSVNNCPNWMKFLWKMRWGCLHRCFKRFAAKSIFCHFFFFVMLENILGFRYKTTAIGRRDIKYKYNLKVAKNYCNIIFTLVNEIESRTQQLLLRFWKYMFFVFGLNRVALGSAHLKNQENIMISPPTNPPKFFLMKKHVLVKSFVTLTEDIVMKV